MRQDATPAPRAALSRIPWRYGARRRPKPSRTYVAERDGRRHGLRERRAERRDATKVAAISFSRLASRGTRQGCTAFRLIHSTAAGAAPRRRCIADCSSRGLPTQQPRNARCRHTAPDAAATAGALPAARVFFLLRRAARARQALEREPLLKAASSRRRTRSRSGRTRPSRRARRGARIEAVAEQAAPRRRRRRRGARRRRSGDDRRRRRRRRRRRQARRAQFARAPRPHTHADAPRAAAARQRLSRERPRRSGRAARATARAPTTRSSAELEVDRRDENLYDSHTRESPRRARAPLPP